MSHGGLEDWTAEELEEEGAALGAAMLEAVKVEQWPVIVANLIQEAKAGDPGMAHCIVRMHGICAIPNQGPAVDEMDAKRRRLIDAQRVVLEAVTEEDWAIIRATAQKHQTPEQVELAALRERVRQLDIALQAARARAASAGSFSRPQPPPAGRVKDRRRR